MVITDDKNLDKMQNIYRRINTLSRRQLLQNWFVSLSNRDNSFLWEYISVQKGVAEDESKLEVKKVVSLEKMLKNLPNEYSPL